MVYWMILVKSYSRNLQYRLSHLINNVASAIFGFVYIAIWTGILEGRDGISAYNAQDMSHYISFNQCLMWLTTFLTAGLGVQLGVRSGAVSHEMMRPVDFFLYTISHEAGKLMYNFFYRSLPIGLIFIFTVGFYAPHHVLTYIWTVFSTILAIYLGLTLYYIVGIVAFWTTEIQWAHFINFTLITGLGGQLIPIPLLPGFLSTLSLYLPFAGVIYYPTMIFLEKVSPEVIWIQLGWAILLTIICQGLTFRARKRIEIQGG